MARRPRARGGTADRGQLSFFDPGGELGALREEARGLVEAEKLHRERANDLNQAVARTRMAVEQFRNATLEIAADAVRVDEALAEQWTVQFVHDGDRLTLEDDSASSSHLENRLAYRLANLSECAFEIQTAAGFRMTVASHDNGQSWLVPELHGPSTFVYGGDESGIRLSDNVNRGDLIAVFESLLAGIPTELQFYRAALERSEAELTGYQRQLEALVEPDPARLAQLR